MNLKYTQRAHVGLGTFHAARIWRVRQPELELSGGGSRLAEGFLQNVLLLSRG